MTEKSGDSQCEVQSREAIALLFSDEIRRRSGCIATTPLRALDVVAQNGAYRFADAVLAAIPVLAQASGGCDKLDIVRTILKMRWPHRTDREVWITAFIDGKSAGVPGKFYFDVNDAFAVANALTLPSASRATPSDGADDIQHLDGMLDDRERG